MDNNQQSNNIEERLKREDILRILEVGSKSKYWKLLEEKINFWIKKEQDFLDGFQVTGISEQQRYQYNLTVERIYLMKKVLNINEILTSENKTILEKLKEKILSYSGVAKSFFELKS